MLLPQSSAFAALKNRLNSVSAIGLLHTPASFPSGPRGSTAGMGVSGTSMGTPGLQQTSLTGPGGIGVPRLNRSSRDGGPGTNVAGGPGGTGGDVKWPELLEKFRQTQEKARRRNERVLRGQSGAEHEDGGADAAGGIGAARRSLLELRVDTHHQHHNNNNTQIGLSGRLARGQQGRDDERAQFSAGLRPSHNRPGSGLGKPLPLRPDSRSSGQFGRNSVDSSRPTLHELGDTSSGAGMNSGAAAGGGGVGVGDSKGKSRHSLAGNLGKFASGIGRAGSRDKERREREREGRR